MGNWVAIEAVLMKEHEEELIVHPPLLNIDDRHISEAQHWIEQAIEADERNGMRFHLGRDYALYAELLNRKGDRKKAIENLGKAIKTYKECGADGWVTKAEEELGRLS